MKTILNSVGNTPLIHLASFSANTEAEIFGKQESRNPLGSVKCRTAVAMIDAAEREGKINEKSTIIEPTSGNTGIGLAFVCARKRLSLILTMPESMSLERRKLLKHLGAQLILTPAAEGMKGAIKEAEKLAKNTENSFMPNQFTNPANPEIHRTTTAPEILHAMNNDFDIFVAGVGTGGTITGVSEVVKKRLPHLISVAVEPEESPVLSGGSPGPHGIQGIGAGFVPEILNTDIIDKIIKVNLENAIAASRELAREEGIFCGISSGAAAYAARKLAQMKENCGKKIVVILPDTGERYLTTSLFQN